MRLDFTVPFSRFFDLLGRNFGLFAGLGVVGVTLPALLFNFGFYYYTGVSGPDLAQNIGLLSPLDWWIAAGGSVVMVALQLINLSMVTEFAILRAVNKPVDIGAAIGNAVRNLLPLIAVSILVGLMVMGGMILLIVPGIIWALASCVAVPAYVSERGIGITGAISRSFELTRNNRWMLFAIFIVAIFLFSLVSGVIGLIITGVSTGTNAIDGSVTTTMSLAQNIGVAFDSAGNILSNVFIAALYVCLRELPGKQTASQAAAVFE